jgi:hypothetical protein
VHLNPQNICGDSFTELRQFSNPQEQIEVSKRNESIFFHCMDLEVVLVSFYKQQVTAVSKVQNILSL